MGHFGSFGYKQVSLQRPNKLVYLYYKAVMINIDLLKVQIYNAIKFQKKENGSFFLKLLGKSDSGSWTGSPLSAPDQLVSVRNLWGKRPGPSLDVFRTWSRCSVSPLHQMEASFPPWCPAGLIAEPKSLKLNKCFMTGQYLLGRISAAAG